MNLINNPNWATVAKSYFTLGESILVKNEECLVDYSYKTIDGELVAFGYDFSDVGINENEIFHFLKKDKSENGESSLMTRMFKFSYFQYSPIVFLVSKNKVYYMPSGVNQLNQSDWINIDNISTFIDFLLLFKNRLEEKYQDVYTRKQEELHPINISDIKSKYSDSQISILSKRPLWFEESKHENTSFDVNNKHQLKLTKTSLSRLCIQTNSSNSNIKLKIDISCFEHSYGGTDPEDYLIGNDTKYFSINKSGNIEESNFEQGEIYTLLEM
jgi:hypothetical protein